MFDTHFFLFQMTQLAGFPSEMSYIFPIEGEDHFSIFFPPDDINQFFNPKGSLNRIT